MHTPSKKIYFSASIRGENADLELGYKVVTYLKEQGHDVLSEHVGSRNSDEMNAKLLEKTGTDRLKLVEPRASQFIREIDTAWVDEADCLVVVITGASLGVGMEIERALLKPERGMPETPIFCFVHATYAPGLSAMVRGVSDTTFHLFSYTTFEEIREQLAVIFS